MIHVLNKISKLLNYVLLTVSAKYNVVITYNAINKYILSYSSIGRFAKTFDIDLKTKRDGLFK